jgi:hypothetical protein
MGWVCGFWEKGSAKGLVASLVGLVAVSSFCIELKFELMTQKIWKLPELHFTFRHSQPAHKPSALNPQPCKCHKIAINNQENIPPHDFKPSAATNKSKEVLQPWNFLLQQKAKILFMFDGNLIASRSRNSHLRLFRFSRIIQMSCGEENISYHSKTLKSHLMQISHEWEPRKQNWVMRILIYKKRLDDVAGKEQLRATNLHDNIFSVLSHDLFNNSWG